MRILITNTALANRSGSELYVRDLAFGLLERGHTPLVYSPILGAVAQEIRAATIPVVDHLDKIALPPDLIHGQHHLETLTALLHFPGIPAVAFCHGWAPWEENPLRFPRILRYVAVDLTCRDRLLFEHGIPEKQIQVLFNFVDLQRFCRRAPLPVLPQRALIFNNHATERTHLPALREACSRLGLKLDVMGAASKTASSRPEKEIGQYDLVFAIGRSALEALAVGAAVVLCSAAGVGPLVTVTSLTACGRSTAASGPYACR
jgi:glycosyl transferase family 4